MKLVKWNDIKKGDYVGLCSGERGVSVLGRVKKVKTRDPKGRDPNRRHIFFDEKIGLVGRGNILGVREVVFDKQWAGGENGWCWVGDGVLHIVYDDEEEFNAARMSLLL